MAAWGLPDDHPKELARKGLHERRAKHLAEAAARKAAIEKNKTQASTVEEPKK